MGILHAFLSRLIFLRGGFCGADFVCILRLQFDDDALPTADALERGEFDSVVLDSEVDNDDDDEHAAANGDHGAAILGGLQDGDEDNEGVDDEDEEDYGQARGVIAIDAHGNYVQSDGVHQVWGQIFA